MAKPFRKGFRTKARTRKARPDDRMKQENPTKTTPQVYAKIPGHDIAEVVEMVYRYQGRRRKLDHIFVTWPHIGPNKRRFKMTPFIRIKKRKARPWYYKPAQAAARYLVAVIKFFKPGKWIKPADQGPTLTPTPVQPYHIRHTHEAQI